MKKLIVIGLLLVSLIESKAAVATLTVATGVMTNFSGIIAGKPFKLLEVIVTSPSTNAASFQLLDTYTNWFKYTNSGYSSISTYATNLTVAWTNVYGVSNGYATTMIVDYTNTVTGVTNLFPTLMNLSSGTNVTTTYNNLNVTPVYGLWVTNLSPASGTLTINYVQ